MKRSLRIAAIALIALVLIISVLIYGFLQGWHIKKQTPEELALLLKPYFQIKTPAGEGPFPTILGFHGGAGMSKGLNEWQNYFVELGYATILVDSYKGRASTDEDIAEAGKSELLGFERVGDILVAIAESRKLEFVDKQEIALIGWSAGAWAIMDLLAMDPPKEIPANLKYIPDQTLEGVKTSILFYPYCGYLARSLRGGWTQEIDVLMLLAGKDSVVQTEACLDIVTILENNNKPIQSHVYPYANHAFDMHYEGNEELPPSYNPEVAKDARERVKQFLAEVFNPR